MTIQQPPTMTVPMINEKCPDDRKSSPLPGCPRVEEIVLHLNRLALAEPNPYKVAQYREAIAHLGEALKIK